MGYRTPKFGPGIHHHLKNKYAEGALVTSVYSDLPGGTAGITVNDIVIEVDGKRTINADAALVALAAVPLHQAMVLTIVRDGKELRIDMKRPH
jgi:S1-C subfamily serine protease